MLGRLARYLRFVGLDTEYARGLDDDEILRRSRAEGRRIVTRDRGLAARSPEAVLLRSGAIAQQWNELRAAYPRLPTEVRFVRCSACNGLLSPYLRGTDPARETGLPRAREGWELPLFACRACGQLYWEGSHTRRIRATLARWSGEAPPE